MRRIEIIRVNFDALQTDAAQALWIADTDYEVLRIQDRFRVGSTSGTYRVFKAPSGTAPASGTAVQAATADISTVATADTNRTPALSTVAGAKLLPAGNALCVVFAGDATGLRGLCLTILVRRRKERPAGMR